MTQPAPDYEDSEGRPWDRQPNESTRAYEAFRLYRDTDPGERSQRKVAAALNKSGALIGRWSSTHHWVERAEAYDAEQDRQWQKSLAVKRRRAVDRHLRLAHIAQQKVAQGLVDMDGSKLTPSELIRLLDVVVRIERDALGVPQRHEVTGPAGNPLSVQVAEFASMGAEQRRLAIEEMVAAVRRRAEAAAGGDDDDDDDDRP